MSAPVDPLLKDLTEKKQSFRRNVVCLAEELKEVRDHLVSQQQFVANETLEAESKLQRMQEEARRIEKSLKERSLQLEASVSVNKMYVVTHFSQKTKFLVW